VNRSIRTILAAAAACLTADAAPASPPARATVLTGTAARDVLHQCSRSTPEAGTSFFAPAPVEIDRLDRAVSSSRVRRLPPGAGTLRTLKTTYAVEVVGIVRSGQRFVYGNYYPLSMQDGVKSAPGTATAVCDGGPRFFGAEIDAVSGHITHMDFNGPG